MALSREQELQRDIQRAELAQQRAVNEEAAAAALADGLEKSEKQLAAQTKQLNQADLLVARQEELVKLYESLGPTFAAQAATARSELATRQSVVDALKATVKTQEKVLEYQKIIAADADQILTTFLGITSETKQFGKSLKAAGSPTKLLKDRFAAAKSEVKKIGGNALALNAALKTGSAIAKDLGKALLAVAQITLEPVKNAVNFEQAIRKGREEIDSFKVAARDLGILESGGIDRFFKSMTSLRAGTRATREELKNVTLELFNSSNAFRELTAANDPATRSLTKTAFLLQRRLNVSIKDVSGIAEKLSLSFGLTGEEATDFASSLAVLADEMGLKANKVLSETPQLMSTLSKFNIPDLQREILKLGKIQQMTGISLDQMMGSLEKFTTFEGALTAAANLNAVFGTTVDGLELMDTVMMKGPIAGFIQLRKTLEATGIQIDKLNFAQLRSLSSTLGLLPEQLLAFGKVSAEEFENITAGSMSGADAIAKLRAAQGEGETIEEIQNQLQNDLIEAIQGQITATHDNTKALLEAAKLDPESASVIERFKKPIMQAIGAVGGAALGTVTMGPGAGTAAGAYMGFEGMGQLSTAFAPGATYVSKPTLSKMGEAGGTEIHDSLRTMARPMAPSVETTSGITAVLNTGDRVTRDPSLGKPTNLTVNFFAPDGSLQKSTTQTISPGETDKAFNHFLEEHVGLLGSTA